VIAAGASSGFGTTSWSPFDVVAVTHRRSQQYQYMVQSINTKAIWTLATIVRRPSLLVPQLSVATVSDIDYVRLRELHGIRAIIYDKDHTLTAPYIDDKLHPAAQRGLQQAETVFGRSNIAILSNSAGTNDDVDQVAARTIEASLHIAVIRHAEKKPGGLPEVLRHFSSTSCGTNGTTIDPRDICIVGDRILTDVVFGNLHGMYTIHTQALPLLDSKNDRDNWTARILRPMENALLYGRLTRNFWQRRKLPHQKEQGRRRQK
jgi:phosphatidylglycerophosphatase GEP4